MDVFERLALPFSPDRVSWRLGTISKEKLRGLALAYIDARDVMQRLDEVVGPENWQDRYEVHGGKTICYLSISAVVCDGPGDAWITKSDGAGDSDIEAEKGAISDAFKRAAVKWGIGRYLYDLDSPWVEIEEAGKSHRITAQGMSQLRASLNAADPEARAIIWAQANAPAVKRALQYPDAAEILAAAGVNTTKA